MYQPLIVRPLSTSERESLELYLRSSNREESWRAEAILLSAAGKTAAEISEELGYHPSNIKKWIRAFNRKGIEGIAVKKRGPQGGPRPKFTRQQTDEIIKLSTLAPREAGYNYRAWTPQKLADAAVERGIVESISHVTVRQILKKHKSVSMHGNNGNASGVQMTGAKPIVAPGVSRFQLGKEALAGSNFEEAAEHLCAALNEGASSPEEEAIIRSSMSQALEELSKYEDAYDAIRKYDNSQALSMLSPTTRSRVRLRIGLAQSYLGNYPEAIASLNEAKILFLELRDDLGVSEAQYALGRTYIEINEFRIARDHLLAAASVQKVTMNRELLARIYLRLGTVDFSEGAFSNSKDNYMEALKLVEGSSNTNLLGMVLLNLGTTIYHIGSVSGGYKGEREKSAEYLKRAIVCLKTGGHKDYLALAYNNLGDNLRYSGLWKDAVESLENAIDVAQRFKQPSYEATARITLGEILSSKGNYSDAEFHLRKSLEIVQGGTEKWGESNALRVLANVQRGNGRIDAALRTLRQALQLSTSIGDLHGVTLAQIGLAECHFLQRGYDQAEEYMELAQGRLKEEKSIYISGLIQRLTGQIEMASGRVAEAKQHIAQSISIFTTTETPYELARSYYEMGLLLKKSTDLKGSEAMLLKAKQIFEQLGAAPDFAMAEDALSLLSSGEGKEPEIIRVSPPSDLLLMQRLIEASASRELLLRELVAVIYENFPVDSAIVYKADVRGELEPLAMQGLSREEADHICTSIDISVAETVSKTTNGYVIGVGDSCGESIALYFRAKEAIDIGRLQPLLKQTDLGLETCSLRAAARSITSTNFESRIISVIPGFIICSKSMFGVIEKIQKIRTSNVTVLITGESGTGKELVARAIHAESARARAIFLPFNCTATPKEIIDSQLFGHRRGAFTGATANYPGIIKAADGGTLFLDEIGDLSLEVQPKLMRFLQESEIQPLGETRPIRVDVRVLAATNTDLERAVEDGRFREDLFHRLNIIRIHVPPLRERSEEVPILAGHFLEHFSSRSGKSEIALTQEALEMLTEYDWPGNVRQLRNEIERVVAYASESARISTADLSPEIAHPRKRASGGRLVQAGDNGYNHNGLRVVNPPMNGRAGVDFFEEGKHVKLKEATAALERHLIEDALIRNKNNLSQTATDLGLSRRGLRLKIETLGIQRESLF